MRLWRAIGLRQKFLVLATTSLIALFSVFSIIGFSALRASTDQTLSERLAVAQGAARSLDFLVNEACEQLRRAAAEMSAQLEQGVELPAPELLSRSSDYLTVPVYYLAFLDVNGRVLAVEPSTSESPTSFSLQAGYIDQALRGETSLSDVSYDLQTRRSLLSIASPLRNSRNGSTGLLVAAIDLTAPDVLVLVKPEELGETGYVEIINSRGEAVASTRYPDFPQEQAHQSWFTGLLTTKQSAVSTCHRCHQEAGRELAREDEIIVFAPSVHSPAPLGISIRQSQQEALAPTRILRQRLIVLGGVSLLIVLSMAFVTTQSLVNPLKALTAGSRRIADGDLEHSVPIRGSGEIRTLAQSLDAMRLRLQQSIERLRDKDRIRGELLRRLISAQEDERRRIARELHDETSQALTSISANIQAAVTKLPSPSPDRARLAKLQDLVLQTLDGIHRLVRDLRPALLDDLGLLMAVKRYAEDRLGPLGIKLHWETADDEYELPDEVESALFRVIQEALTNIARHSGAGIAGVSIEFRDKAVAVSIEDDGNGFDVQAALESKEAWGLYGMIERAEFLGGTVNIRSDSSEGTEITIIVPVNVEK